MPESNKKQKSGAPVTEPGSANNNKTVGARAPLDETAENYWKGWRAYRSRPKAGAVREALGCTASAADRLVKRGFPKLGLPSFEQKLGQLVELANQLDADEGARAVALGRGMIRTLQAKVTTSLIGRGFGPNEINTRDLAMVGLAVQKRVEETSADPDQEQQKLRAEASLGKALGGLLEAVVKRLMPNVGDALPTVEDLKALDVPLILDGEVVDGEAPTDDEAVDGRFEEVVGKDDDDKLEW